MRVRLPRFRFGRRLPLPPGPFSVADSEHVRVLSARRRSRTLEEAQRDFGYAIPAELGDPEWTKRIRDCRGTKVVLEVDRDDPLMQVADVLHVEVARDREAFVRRAREVARVRFGVRRTVPAWEARIPACAGRRSAGVDSACPRA